jgi:hypothetical protein
VSDVQQLRALVEAIEAELTAEWWPQQVTIARSAPAPANYFTGRLAEVLAEAKRDPAAYIAQHEAGAAAGRPEVRSAAPAKAGATSIDAAAIYEARRKACEQAAGASDQPTAARPRDPLSAEFAEQVYASRQRQSGERDA